MQNIDEATRITIELAKLLISTMQSIETPWVRAFVRFQMTEEDNWGCRGSYQTSTGVMLFNAMKEGKQLFHGVNELGPLLRDATSNNGKKCCVFLLIVDSKFNYDIKFEHNDSERWKITKLNGDDGLPVGLQ